MTDSSQKQDIRIPNLPWDRMVDDLGYATPTELTFRQTLISNLQKNFGDEGCVVPSLSSADITVIQNNQVVNPATNVLEYTVKAGTMVYNSTNDTLMVCIYSAGVPTFKTVTVT